MLNRPGFSGGAYDYTTVETLIGVPATRTAGKREPQTKIAQQQLQIEALPKVKQRPVSQGLDSVIAAHQ